MKIRDLLGEWKPTARDQELDNKELAPWKAARQGVSNLSKSFSKGFGGGADPVEPNKDLFRRTPDELGKVSAKDPKATGTQPTGTYQKKPASGIDPELEKAIAALSPEQQREVLNQIKQGKI